jgi:4-amino-4-deoxy-L-arabinose transferase-like glycosyltransferase
LNTFDDINFALAIGHFNPAQHQPQPPGYPLFVGLLKIGALFVPKVEYLFLAVALLASLLALVFLWAIGDRLLGKPLGLIAALLLLFHPTFWFAALTNPIRLFLAAGATAVALCLLQACGARTVACRVETRLDARVHGAVLSYYLAAFVWGLAAGFRPFLLVTLFPLMLYAAWRLRLNAKQIFIALALAALPIAAWFTALVIPVGGVLKYFQMMRLYWDQQGSSSSILLGARISSALHMAYMTMVWTFVGVLSWVWCVPFVFRSAKRWFTRFEIEFLLVWLVPGFVFYATVHTGDPDHPLSIVPVTCLMGAAVLARFAREYAPRSLPAVVAAAVALNALMFFKPVNKTAKAGSYKVAQWLDGYMNGVMTSVEALHAKGPVAVVSAGPSPGWRNVSYYFPDIPVLVVSSSNPQKPFGWVSSQGISRPLAIENNSILLPACRTIAWIDFNEKPVSQTGPQGVPVFPNASVTVTEPGFDTAYRFRGFSFRTAHNCE